MLAPPPLSLAHACIAPQGEESHVPVADFPEISSSWEGFALPHLHWIGMHEAYVGDGVALARATMHETAHWYLARSAVIGLLRGRIYELQGALDTFCQFPNERRQVQVPLRGKRGGHPLERLWHDIGVLKRLADPVEEAFAVWGSLYMLWDKRLIIHETRRDLEREAKWRYRQIKGFAGFYDRFASLADQLGFTATRVLAQMALMTPAPKAACDTMITQAAALGTRVSKLADQEEALHFFNDIALALLHAAEGKALTTELVEVILLSNGIGVLLDEAHASAEPARPAWLRYPAQATMCTFGQEQLRIGMDDTKSMMSLLWTESLRQQLTTGIGLRCPFWESVRHSAGCCGLQNILEGVWAQTSAQPDWEHWQRRGCLCSC